MKRITAFPYVVAFVAALLTISCQKETGNKQDTATPGPDGTITLTDYEIASIAYAHPKELSTAQALGILRHFEDSISRTPGTKSTSKSTFEVVGKSYINEKGSTSQVTKGSSATTVPVFNVIVKKGSQRGLAVVSADERVPLVIAYTQEAKGPEDPMLLLSRLSLVDKVKEVEKIVDSLYTPTIRKLEQKFGKIPGNNVYDFVKRRIGRPGTKSEVEYYLNNPVISIVGPLTNTYWDQHEPYNLLMPSSNCPNGSPNAPYPAGCFVIAAAQVQAYYRPNLQVNINGANTALQWDAMLSTPYGGDEGTNQNTRNHLTAFIKKVFDGCATTPSCDGSSTNSTSGIAYLRQTLNVNNGISINMTDIKNSLDQLKLVLATGFREPNNDGNPKVGHAWVVDGYAVTRLNPGETIVGNNVWQRYNMYLHCNMGWGSFWAGSGWYLVGKDNIGSLTFAPNSAQEYKINLTFFSNISKK